MKPKSTLESTDSIHLSQMSLNLALAEQVSFHLRHKGLKIAIAESCTGGLLSYHFSALSGASSIFSGGMITYSNAMKAAWLGVESEDLNKYGAVSEVVVRGMCEGILRQSGADVALATSGIAGPSGGSEQIPLGCVYIGVQFKASQALVRAYQFQGDRNSVQIQSCTQALELLLALLQA